MLPEDELVDLIARAAGSSRDVLVGIGDDAAVLAGGLVASTDILVEGVHFDSGAMDARSIGHRAAAANLSDMAAMGAQPLCLLAAVGLPKEFTGVGELAEGWRAERDQPAYVQPYDADGMRAALAKAVRYRDR